MLFAHPRTWPTSDWDDFISNVSRILQDGLLRRRSSKSTAWKLDLGILGLFAEMSPSASHEDFEDFLHFVIESHQFAGAPVVFDEIDLDQVSKQRSAIGVAAEMRCLPFKVATDLRGCLDRLHDSQPTQSRIDQHTFLVLDKDAQKYPWESLPSVRGRSFSRIPTLAFLTDMAHLLPHWKTGANDGNKSLLRHLSVDAHNTSYMLNPGGDLPRTQSSFEPWLKGHASWKGICGRKPMTLEVEQSLGNSDIFMCVVLCSDCALVWLCLTEPSAHRYIGHGGAEDYIRSDTLRRLPRCAVTFLWGCSSGTLRARGQFDAEGTPWNYLMAGWYVHIAAVGWRAQVADFNFATWGHERCSPTLVANLWDVTDKDIDKVTRFTFERSGLRPFSQADASGDEAATAKATRESPVSIAQAVAEARDCCRMNYLNGAAPVVYGLPAWIKCD